MPSPSAAGISTRGRAFERALRVLDDSFVRTYHDVGQIFVRPYDPSVADFLMRRISPDKLRLTPGWLSAAAVFFEQVQALDRLTRVPHATSLWRPNTFNAVERCLCAPSCSWHAAYFGHGATEPTTIRSGMRLESRVNAIGEMKRWEAPYRDEPLRSRVGALYRSTNDAVRGRWARGEGDLDVAMYLLRAMHRRREDIDAHGRAVKHLITAQLHYAQAFRRLLTLRELAPAIFEEEEWDELRRSYRVVAEEELANWSEMGDVDEVDEIQRYADWMGVDLDQDVLRDVRERLEERIAEAEDRASDEAREHDPEEEPDVDNDDVEIEALFIRLAEQVD